MELQGAVSIVTGGNGGLGQRICRALAEAGSDVAVVYARSRDEAMEVAAALRDAGVRAGAFQCDVTRPDQIERMVSEVQQAFERIDVLVNDAAYNKMIPFSDLDGAYEEWDRMMDINLKGPMMCIRAVVPVMRRLGAGRVVNISSVAGMSPSGSSIPYGVAKAGLNHLTRCTAVGLAPEILVNCIAAGYMEGTRATANLDPEFRRAAREGAVLRRPVDKDDVAAQVVAFCRTDSVTGQTLVMDSGRLFH